ncbi:MAG: hypothetical protein RL660_229 [Bacteroidota bacterium]|jgi:hypothetical protein
MQNKSEILTGWNLSVHEVSNNVYEVTAEDVCGRSCTATDKDLEKATETCLCFAFDIEKQLRNPMSKFLCELFNYLLVEQQLLALSFDEQNIGSWTIQKDKKRLVLCDAEQKLSLQRVFGDTAWVVEHAIYLSDL